MNREVLGILRDIAALLLCLECAIFLAVPGVALFFAQIYLRKGRRALRVPLLRVLVLTLRVQHATTRLSNAIVNVPIRIQMLGARVRGMRQTLLSGR